MAEAKKTITKKTSVKAKATEEKVKLEEIKEQVGAVVETEAEEVVTEAKEEKTTAKAGKRSAKALKEAEEKEAKEARKAETKSEEDKPAEKPKVIQKPARSRLERRGKNYRKAAELIDKTKSYTLAEALGLAAKTSPVKFDASVELHVNLGVDPRQADQNIRETVVLPAGTGKTVKIAVLAEADAAVAAKKAGADVAGEDDLLAQLEKGVIDFDVLIATPSVMPKLGKYARLLGPRGLMPNPKSGTVTPDVAKAVQEAKAGRVEYRVDSTGIVHVAIGKVSFGPAKLGENAGAVVASIKAAKPASLKGNYLKSAHVTTSMGPSINIAVNSL